MRRDVGFVNMDSSLVSWLADRLQGVPPDVRGADDLAEAIGGLADGSCTSILVEMDGSGGTFYGSDEIRCDDLSIFARSRKVIRSGTEIALTPKEFDILYFLAENRGEVFTKEQIYRAVWEDKYMMDDSNIMAFIRKLRKKIEPIPDSPRYILTVWGIGYKFNDAI